MQTYAAIDLHSNNGVLTVIDETDKILRQKKLPNRWRSSSRSSGRISNLIASCERRLRWDTATNDILDRALPLLRR